MSGLETEANSLEPAASHADMSGRETEANSLEPEANLLEAEANSLEPEANSLERARCICPRWLAVKGDLFGNSARSATLSTFYFFL
jgi:hypothetical protein